MTTAVNIFGALSISFGTVYQKRFATALNLASGGAWQYVGATLAVGIPALFMEQMRFDGSFDAWFALGWSVVVLSLGAITLLMLLIRISSISSVMAPSDSTTTDQPSANHASKLPSKRICSMKSAGIPTANVAPTYCQAPPLARLSAVAKRFW